jgi:hypothetical protein
MCFMMSWTSFYNHYRANWMYVTMNEEFFSLKHIAHIWQCICLNVVSHNNSCIYPDGCHVCGRKFKISGKWSNRKYVNTRIFRLTTSRSPKFIPKADLKRACPYFYSKFFFEAFWSIFKKVKKWISHCIFKKWFDWGRYIFWPKKILKRPNFPKYAYVLVVACRKPKSNSAR